MITLQTGKRFPECMLFHHVTLSLTPLCGAARKEDSRMSEEVIVRLGAPTLAGIKTGSLFTYAYTSRKSVEESLRQLNRCFAPKGLCLLPLRYSEKNVLLYLFRPAELSRDLKTVKPPSCSGRRVTPAKAAENVLQRSRASCAAAKSSRTRSGCFSAIPPRM